MDEYTDEELLAYAADLEQQVLRIRETVSERRALLPRLRAMGLDEAAVGRAETRLDDAVGAALAAEPSLAASAARLREEAALRAAREAAKEGGAR